MSIEASGKNMQAVCQAKDVHNRTCPYGGNATNVHLNWFDLERIGWEEGDVICGLVVMGDERVATGMMRVTCDAEPDDLDGLEEEAEDELVEAVGGGAHAQAPDEVGPRGGSGELVTPATGGRTYEP